MREVYSQLCNSYRAIDEFRSKLLSLLPLATGGLFFFITNRDGLMGKAIKSGVSPEAGASAEALKNMANNPTSGLETEILSPEIVQAIGWFGVVITFGLFCYELYGIRKCTNLIYLGMRLEIDLGDIKGQFLMRPDAVLSNYFGDKYKFIGINEPFAAGIIYPAVMAAWTFIALRNVHEIT